MINYVSTVELNTTFEISSPIVNPMFALSPPSAQNTYEYVLNGTEISFLFSMASGSNVKLTVYAGDDYQNLNKQPSIEISTIGDWNNGINNKLYNVVKYTFKNPGDFGIVVNVSNALKYFILTSKIRIISRVDDLIPSLVSVPVVFKPIDDENGMAEFKFTYSGASKAGSHSNITFWPGDSTNATFGPYELSMDFNANISKAGLVYIYNATGAYVCTFRVENPLGFKYFSLKVPVVGTMYGFYIDVVPKYARPNQLVKVSAYMIQGVNVTFTLVTNGTYQTIPRLCKCVFLVLK